jgi:TRAP-type C4-dicarboxylate transport system permease small subunit
MNARQFVAIVLIVAGTLGLIYRGFTYTQQTHEARVGSLQFSISQRNRVDVPLWISVAGIVVGVGLLLTRPKA